MHPPSPTALVEAGLVESWLRLCRLLPGASLYRHDGLVLALSNVGDPTLHALVPEAGADPVRPAEAVEVLDGLCAAHGARLAVDLATRRRPALEEALGDAGLRPAVRRRGMVASLTAVPPPAVARLPGTYRVREALPSDRPALRRLEEECFGLSPLVTERFLSEAVLADPDFRTVVAERDTPSGSEVVAKAHGHLPDTSLGISGVATTTSARRRGLAGALVVELLRGARDRGASWSWLLAEPPAAGVYLGVGFVHVAEWYVWLRP